LIRTDTNLDLNESAKKDIIV